MIDVFKAAAPIILTMVVWCRPGIMGTWLEAWSYMLLGTVLVAVFLPLGSIDYMRIAILLACLALELHSRRNEGSKSDEA